MNNPDSPSNPDADAVQAMSAMFASLVIQDANMALILLGKAPNPQTGQTIQDLEHAKYFIDQLEMLEVKTKGNLEKHETALLKQSLTSLRMAYVEAVDHPLAPSQTGASAGPPVDEEETPVADPALPGEPPQPPPSEPAAESHKKFSKKY
jgi:uncharacterized membrane protein YdfJ with MMPL/SSD domain